MIVDIECPRCRGEGWLLQRAPRLGPGLYEVTCEHCNGHGAYHYGSDIQFPNVPADKLTAYDPTKLKTDQQIPVE